MYSKFPKIFFLSWGITVQGIERTKGVEIKRSNQRIVQILIQEQMAESTFTNSSTLSTTDPKRITNPFIIIHNITLTQNITNIKIK